MVAAAAAALLLASPLPARAEVIQTVTASQAVDAARPLPKRTDVHKGTVWLVFVGGAAGLFLATLAVENNEAWFPAISRANRFITMSRERAAQQAVAQPPPQPEPIDVEAAESERLTAAVVAGLAEARTRSERATPSAWDGATSDGAPAEPSGGAAEVSSSAEGGAGSAAAHEPLAAANGAEAAMGAGQEPASGEQRARQVLAAVAASSVAEARQALRDLQGAGDAAEASRQ